ncbi:MAG: calcium/sodium antiporter [Bacteroidales bacterium]|nr:calcium/sodium antiporter [Bacteroidales bacterium]MDZ4204721.1 calcium/sodium antiporter [Bacteroidales bacterium]
MVIHIILLLLGLALLVKGADGLVEGASALARKFNVSDLAIGLTIVAFGTSAPELVVNTIASYQEHYDVVLGNIIGSNNFNLFFILGIAGLITPLTVHSNTVWREIPFSFLAVMVVLALANEFFRPDDKLLLSRVDAIVLLVFFVLFLFYVYKQLKTDPLRKAHTGAHFSNCKIWAYILLGLIGLVAGGRLVVYSAVEMATMWGVSEKIIGLTIIAAGTSLPELATSVVAAYKKNSDIAMGNIIGSNIFNLFFILSVSAFIRPIPFNPAFNTDLYILAGGTVFIFVAMFSGKKRKLDRWEAGLLLAAFMGYMFFLVGKEM